ncbi:MAG: hypothetical protein LUH36_00310 [Oscillospiraceae bacterium]|nr:hypothetical protein [Oscillospiraceae bacterium]
MKRALCIVFIVLFFAACLVPVVGLAVNGPSEAAANEAPVAKLRLIKLDGTLNKSFLSDLQTYVSNGFYLRLNLITAWDKLCANVFHTSANEDVLIGPDGWLFYGAAVDGLSGANQLTDREIWCCARSLYLMQEYTESQGAVFVFAVPCGKYTLYPEHAPSYVTVAEGSSLTRLTEAMDEQGVSYADLYAAFTAVDEELYWKWDSHWNSKGAALAADTILATAGMESDYFSGPFTAEETHLGDLYEMLYPTGTELEADYTWSQGFTFTYTSSFGSYDDVTIQTANESGTGSLLMFRDSSGRNLYPYMAQSFAVAMFSRLSSYRLDYIAEQQADVVVIELAERTLDYILEYPAVYPAPVRDESVLTGAVKTESTLTAAEAGATMEGYIQLTGTLPETAVDSPVYIVTADGAVYEAIPNEGSFTAWLPEETEWETAAVYVFQ